MMSCADQALMITRPVNAASALFSGFRHFEAVSEIYAGVEEGYGPLSTAHIQLCPQHHGIVDERLIARLKNSFPDTQFRLHANVRTERKHLPYDASSGPVARDYFVRLGELSRLLGAPAYTLHAGRAAQSSLNQAFDQARALTDQWQIPVGIEGLYPNKSNGWLLSSWADYARLLTEDVFYAIDMSHLNIVARSGGIAELGLARELVANPRCIEVHISDNDGSSDAHRIIEDPDVLWWWSALADVNEGAQIFSEGIQLMQGPMGPRAPGPVTRRYQPVINS